MADARAEYTALSDQEVVARAREGREPAYRELIRRYERPVFSLIFRMVRDRELAEDLTQETFVKALNAVESYRPEFKFSSWIFKIANNAAIDHLRRRELQTLSLEGAPNAVTPEAIEATALQLRDRLEPAELLAELHRIESGHGRVREERWGPRTLDLDLIATEGEPVSTSFVVIPHPRSGERRFVLEPLVEVWPDATVSGGVSAAEALSGVLDQTVARVEEL